MKTRDQMREEVARLNKRFILLSMPTGLGKTYTALHTTYYDNPLIPPKVLIVYPKNPIKDSWLEDIHKWDYDNMLDGITFTTYNSLAKHTNEAWDMILFDEGHHITERVMTIVESMKYRRVMVLSATIKPMLRYQLQILFPGLYIYKVSMKDAIDSEILPDPKIILWPLTYKMTEKNLTLVRNPKVKEPVKKILFEERLAYTDKKTRYLIPCTEAQYALDFDQRIDWYKKKIENGNGGLKNVMLHESRERLKWLASRKTPYILDLLKKLGNERVLTFCANIEQVKEVGDNCIHSKNKLAHSVLDDFNNGKIGHITACEMLDEGVNLTSCRIGIFANINASERMQIQRIGRILRHEKPIIIIPYYKGSREEDIVRAMLVNYNKDLISEVKSVDEIIIED